MLSVAQALELAVQHHQAGNFGQAEQLYRQILQAQPNHFDALHLLGVIACQVGRPEKGAEHIAAALRINPYSAEAYNNLGNALHESGRPEEAIQAFQQALLINSNYAQPYNNLGNVLEEQDKFDDAINYYRRAISLQPNYADAHNNLGFALRCQGRLEEAAASYRDAFLVKPDYGEAHKNFGVVRLLQGKLAEGWAEYQWRWRGAESPIKDITQPVWDGSPLEGRTILIHPDQGLGDILNFVRYVPRVKQHGGRVIMPCPVELFRLMKTCPGIDELLPLDGPLPPFDVHIPLLCLAPLFGTNTVESIPGDVPYLSAEPDLIEKWRAVLGAGLPTTPPQRATQPMLVGITWRSSPTHRGHIRKSVNLEEFKTLAQLPGVKLISLQKGLGSEQLEQNPGLALNLGPELTDLAETAAVVKNLSLVITIDTALAHLAGSLAVPTWVPLPCAPDWRWLTDREDTPWYPRPPRLFRQNYGGTWREVFQRIAIALGERVARE